MTTTGEELTKQTSLASNLLAEHRWRDAGEALSVINTNDKVIEEKEKELIDCIAQNYSRIKGVERELAGLQLQLKLTNGPKKSALELIRKKIEMQNEHVVFARTKHQAARKVAEATEAALREEEAKKDKLCQELNMLVQQSAHAQLERLEQLTSRMETLNAGFVTAVAATPPTVGASDLVQRSATAAAAQPHHPSGQNAADAEDGGRESRRQELDRPATPPRMADPDMHGPPTPATQARSQGQVPPQQQQSPEAQREAAAARARHVSLQKPRRAAGNPNLKSGATPVSEQRRPSAGNEPFTGF